MKQFIQQHLLKLSPLERRELSALANRAGMTVEEWVEFGLKAQIYHNAEERLIAEPAA